MSKYQLSKKDDARWTQLLTRHCVNYTDISGKQHRSCKYPPLSLAEAAEFEALTSKRSAKIASHPAVQAEIRASKRLCRRADWLLAKLERQLNQALKKVKK
jgi:hypothetical protein